jgi:subfamily B ATP-binding cassette protein MsbA
LGNKVVENAGQAAGKKTGGNEAKELSALAAARRVAAQYLYPYRWHILTAVAANIVVGAVGPALPFLLQQTIDLLFVADPSTDLKIDVPFAGDGLTEDMTFGSSMDVLPYIAGAAALIMVVRAFATYISNIFMATMSQNMIAALQRNLFQKLVWSDLGWVQQTHSGRFISIFLNDVTRLESAMSQTIVNMTRHLIMLVGLLAYMIYLDWLLTILATCVGPLIVVFLRRIGKRTRKATTKNLNETATLSSLISEALKGIRVVKAYGQESHETDRAQATILKVLEHRMKAVRARAAASPLTEAFSGLGFAAVIYYAGYQGGTGAMTSGEFMGFGSALLLAYQPLKAVANQGTVMQEGAAAASRIFPVLDEKAEIADMPGAVPLKVSSGEIRFENVSFHYRDGTEALHAVDIDVPHGKTVALVGPSGAGKSTILNLVPRFYDASHGRVLIDGQHVRDVTLASLREASALVTQEPFLFDDTIRANIAYGVPDTSQEAVEAAARAAAAHDFILALKDGYDTVVGEGGLKLSGGQRQRIAIARAMLKNAPILLLDEATSSLDTASEQQVQEALSTLMKGRTTLVIAHRLSTIMHADRIYVIDGGRVLEQGTHSELLAKGGLYAELYQTQFAQDGGGETEMPADAPLKDTEQAAAGE